MNYFNDIEIQGIPVESNASEQPVNDKIYTEAKNRVKNLIEIIEIPEYYFREEIEG